MDKYEELKVLYGKMQIKLKESMDLVVEKDRYYQEIEERL